MSDNNKIIPLSSQNERLSKEQCVKMAVASQLYAAAELIRAGLEADNDEAIQLGQGIIVDIRIYEELQH